MKLEYVLGAAVSVFLLLIEVKPFGKRKKYSLEAHMDVDGNQMRTILRPIRMEACSAKFLKRYCEKEGYKMSTLVERLIKKTVK